MEDAGLDDITKIEQIFVGLPDYGPFYTYCALSCIALCRRPVADGADGANGDRVGAHVKNRRKYLKIANKLHRRIKRWVESGNVNLRHIDSLLDAELGDVVTPSRRRNTHLCRKNYDLAILQANRCGYTHEEALCHELFGDFLMREHERNQRRDSSNSRSVVGVGLGIDDQDDIDVKEAKAYFGRAVQLYRDWGLSVRADRLMYGQPSAPLPLSKEHSPSSNVVPDRLGVSLRTTSRRRGDRRGPLSRFKAGGGSGSRSSSVSSSKSFSRSPLHTVSLSERPYQNKIQQQQQQHRRVALPLDMIIEPSNSPVKNNHHHRGGDYMVNRNDDDDDDNDNNDNNIIIKNNDEYSMVSSLPSILEDHEEHL
jgi:hypothetical protein